MKRAFDRMLYFMSLREQFYLGHGGPLGATEVMRHAKSAIVPIPAPRLGEAINRTDPLRSNHAPKGASMS